MTELSFKGKEFVYNHHLAVPFRPLVPDENKGIGPVALDGNLVIHGDNLHALKALLPLYAGKVDCIFIDPPYNTGNEGWCYNDNVNAPMIREWLESNPIGIEDGLRHDKWCAMMWPRLRLLFDLLSDDGVIFICIDDNELYNLRLMLDELSRNPSNWIGTIVWKNVTDNNPTRIAVEHEYIVCFSKSKNSVEKIWKSQFSDVKDFLIRIGSEFATKYSGSEEMQAAYTAWFREHKNELWPLDRYKYIDADGIYTGSQSVHNPGREGYRYDVIHPKTGKPCKEPLMGYRFPEETMRDLLAKDKILFGEDHEKIIELKVYAKDFLDKLPGVIELDGRTAAYELRQLFPERKKAFDTPKPTQLVDKILSYATRKDSLVLDSFAGSGTTAHSVMNLNAKDGGQRRFILIEGEDYADDLTRERVMRVQNGVPGAEQEPFRSGLGGSFTYCTLGDPVELDKVLKGETLPPFAGLGSALFHMATSHALDPATMREDDFYLGTIEGQDVWLIYKPDLEWLKSPESALTLARAKAFAASDPDKRHLVFAPARFVSQKMLAEQNIPVEFVPLPFALYRIDRS
ncbi:site-specific DNA-methyltransferase [Granulibacter bethesdensis]|uniref:site-specific DNA-methyltransferase n=1 Tax=Granulibacter bethesdensis TaxID=364410 RepID=UPI00090ABBC6|nr:site-specific DNA-methyltransferase [Granulibacter bethesdensis]APH59388.1 Type III restriction-modification system methylation subunit [Granulibacter bethesdensis]